MGNTHAVRGGQQGRSGRPLFFTLTETFVLILVAAALIATAAIPAMVRHPHAAKAQTIASAAVRP